MEDDYKEEILARLNKSILYKALKDKCKVKDPEVIAMVDNGVSYAYQRTKTIIRHMGEYTLHDGDHLFRVLYIMERLLTKKNINNLSVPEIMLLILAAFFHDIGMAPSEKEVQIWKTVWDYSAPDFENQKEETLFEDFRQHVLSLQEEQEIIKDFISNGKYSNAETIKGYLIAEYIRKSHANRAREIIDREKILGESLTNRILFRGQDLTVEFANICHSHNEDAGKLLLFDKKYLCGQGTFACLPLLGIILRLADILDFDAKRTPTILFSHLFIKHPISLKEWQKHRAIDGWIITPELIQFSAKCEHPAIEASIREFCDLIDNELSICNNILSTINEFNRNQEIDIQIRIPFKVNRDKIEAKKDIYNHPWYLYRDTKFTLSKKQVIDLLMGTKLYGNSEVALRELLQNSIDACLLRKAQEKNWNNQYEPEIIIKFYEEGVDQILEIQDNGTGMDQHIIDNYYTKVGASFYKSIDYNNLKTALHTETIPISRFGIGILSTFMVADTLIVDTMRIYGPQKSSEALNLRVEGQDSIFWIKPGQRKFVGTTTKLILRKSRNPWEKMNDSEFIESVKKIVLNPPFKILIETSKSKDFIDIDSFKKMDKFSLLDTSWRESYHNYGQQNIRRIVIEFQGKGIMGSCIVALLQEKKKPVKIVDIKSREIEIEDKVYSLRRYLELSNNKIIDNSDTIKVDSYGGIGSTTSIELLNESKSRISLHGIEVSADLFPESWKKKPNQVQILWPFSMILTVDIGGNRDLDLNSARTEILPGEKWIEFEEELSFLVCAGIRKAVEKDYWDQFRTEILETSTNVIFSKGSKRANEFELGNSSFPLVTVVGDSEWPMVFDEEE